MTRFFNQDALENFFSYIRSHGVRNVSPGPTHFMSSYKALVVNNFLTNHSPYSNCQNDDISNLLLNMKDYFLEDISNDLNENNQIINLEYDVSDVKTISKTKSSKCAATYFAGYICKKVMKIIKKHNCKRCCQNLVIWGNRDTDFIEAREYKPNLYLRPGGFLTFAVSRIVILTYRLLPKIATKKNVLKTLTLIMSKEINLVLLNCDKHDLAKDVLNITLKCCIFFWTRKINKIAKGQDSKFIISFHNKTDYKDPYKIRAYNKYKKKDYSKIVLVNNCSLLC